MHTGICYSGSHGSNRSRKNKAKKTYLKRCKQDACLNPIIPSSSHQAFRDLVDDHFTFVDGGDISNPRIRPAHPTADDQPKYVMCKTAVALHMAAPVAIISGKKYSLDYCNTCMLVAEEDGLVFIDNPAICGCPATRFGGCLDCKLCHTKKKAKDRTGALCNKGCGVDLGIGQHLLGTTKEWMILRKFTCS